jgi:uncharacterized protein DUF6518
VSALPPEPLHAATMPCERSGTSRADLCEHSRTWWARRLLAALALGVALGFATQRSIGLGAAANEAFATSTGPWAIAAALIGRWAPDFRSAIMTATVCLWSATIAFYAAGGPPGSGGVPGFWLALIVLVGPVLGCLGRASATHELAGSLAAAVVAGWLIGEALHTALAHPASRSLHYGGWMATRDASSRWLSVAVNGVGGAWWAVAAGGPKRIVAAALLPATAVAAISLIAAELLLGPVVR